MFNSAQIINIFDYGDENTADYRLDGSRIRHDDTGELDKPMKALIVKGYGDLLWLPSIRPNGKRAIYNFTSALGYDVGSGYSCQDFEIDARGALIHIDVGNQPYDFFTFSNPTRLKW